MYRKLKADFVFPITTAPVENGVIILNTNNEVVKIDEDKNYDDSELEIYEGFLVPGFVNAHCHLELSHLKNVAQTGTGLIDFIGQVIKNRNHSQEIIQAKIIAAENEMLQNGIVAVGDISNAVDTFEQKQKGNLHYYTFVEYFDMFQNINTLPTIEQYDAVYQQLAESETNKKSKVPHAPYSVSPKLFDYLIQNFDNNTDKTISIHNQETLSEDALFFNKSGKFVDFYKNLNYTLEPIPKHLRSIHYALEFLKPHHRNLFIHNTCTTKEDILLAQKKLGFQNTYWCTCPNANLYIENSLPNYQYFIDTKAQVCIGTDSLTSNWQLNILEEIKTILKYCSYLSFETVLNWATINGAKALGWQQKFGTLELGKTPGIVHINHTENKSITDKSQARRIV